MSQVSVPSSDRIRRDFLNFFRERQHAIVQSSSLLPKAPNLLFTNAGMNQFVPIFLGRTSCPYKPGRAADTQKCIRAGGKHNDLEAVGWDTYHHTFFEMLGNWSFGDYFKREAIAWAWELLVNVWGCPPERLYATVYAPDKAKGDPAQFDREAYDCWAEVMHKAGLSPEEHIVRGGKKDNFWMMGETGPCGPCSELHIDLTSQGNTRGALVNKDSAACIEIWNLVFIQFNANGAGGFDNLPSKHVDTGMGFERIVGILQNTQRFHDFGAVVSNYESDVFRPLFEELEQLTGKRYRSTLPSQARAANLSAQEQIDVAFRVIGDHVRALSFAIADGILPGNTDRNYVLRRILRRAVRYGRTLSLLREPFLHRLVDAMADHCPAEFFPELHARREQVKKVIHAEEEAFRRTLARGMNLFQSKAQRQREQHLPASQSASPSAQRSFLLSGEDAFQLYDTYGFPLDLTELLAREQGGAVDTERFEELMKAQRERARAVHKKETVEVSSLKTETRAQFCGFKTLECQSQVLERARMKDKTAILLDVSPFYPEMGGQAGDQGSLQHGGEIWKVTDTQKIGSAIVHVLAKSTETLAPGDRVFASVNKRRRRAVERHHTATHLFHWALHEVVSRDASQKGSFVGAEKLTFDFNAPPLTAEQIGDMERLINERILANEPVHCFEVDRRQVEGRSDVMQFFAEKYTRQVRVVQIGGQAGQLNGFSMELCGGTHTRASGEIGLFKIVGEAAVASGVRRIEAIAGEASLRKTAGDAQLIQRLAARLNAPPTELERKLEQTLQQQKQLEKQLKTLQNQTAADQSRSLLASARRIPSVEDRPAIPLIVANLGAADGKTVQTVAENLKAKFSGVIVLGGSASQSAVLVAMVSSEYCHEVRADEIIRGIVPEIDGKGGGRPEFARGGGKNPEGLDRALAKVESAVIRQQQRQTSSPAAATH